MRVTTLKTSAGGLAGLIGYYAGLAEDRTRQGAGRGPVDYYVDPDEPAGVWWGSGLGALGLRGEVQGEDLRSLLAGEDPATGWPLGRSFGERSARGFDATFSAPKSVSALWALTPDRWVRAEVLAAHDAAVTAALGWFEEHGAVTRRGRDGVDQVDSLGVTAALFRQHTSRSMDPQLHTHAVISSKVQDATGKWLALDARFLKFQQRSIGWIYDAALRSELTTRLGVTWDAVTAGPVDLACVPAEVRGVLSKRTGQIDEKLGELLERWMNEHDGDDPDPETIAALERKAVLASRPAKTHGVDAGGLHQEWAAEAESVGFDPDSLTAGGIRRHESPSRVDDLALIEAAIAGVSEESSTWLEADLARHLATMLPADTGRSAQGLVVLIDSLAASAVSYCRDISPVPSWGPCRKDGRPIGEHVTDHRLSTDDILDQEQDLQDWAQASTTPPPATDDPQATAAGAIAGTDGLVVIVGPAGTGKTTTIARSVTTLRHQRRPVVGLAPSGKAADVLATEAGCDSLTLASFLQRHTDQSRPSAWPAGTTVVLDEAAMTRTDDLHRLVTLTRQHQWRLVAVGDPAQLGAVGRGGVFAHWTATVAHHELVTPRRFTEPWEAAASIALRAGAPDVAEIYASHHRLHTTHPALLAARIAREAAADLAAGLDIAITTKTADTARAINRAIQNARPSDPELHVELADGTSAHDGDRVATRRNRPDLVTTEGEPVRNRHTWTVRAVGTDGALTVDHPKRGSVVLPADYVATQVELGWAVTGYGNQGDTVDIAYAILEAGTDRSDAYVALTRGRHANHAFIPDPTGTLDAAEQLAQTISHTPEHDSALASHRALVRTHLSHQKHEPAGPEPMTEPPASSAPSHHEPPGLSL